jgi:hypothetical protein
VCVFLSLSKGNFLDELLIFLSEAAFFSDWAFYSSLGLVNRLGVDLNATFWGEESLAADICVLVWICNFSGVIVGDVNCCD